MPAAPRPVVLALQGADPLELGPRPALLPLGGSPAISRLLDSLRAAELPAPLVVGPEHGAEDLHRAVGDRARVLAVPSHDGRVSRPAAISAALDQLDPADDVLLHEAERALTPVAVVESVLASMHPEDDAVVPVVAVTDSVKQPRETSLVNVDRSTLGHVQAPRLLRRSVLERVLEVLHAGSPEGPVGERDEIRAALRGGARIRTVPGSHAGFAILDRTSLWQAQISLGVARDTRDNGKVASRRGGR